MMMILKIIIFNSFIKYRMRNTETCMYVAAKNQVGAWTNLTFLRFWNVQKVNMELFVVKR